MHECLDTAKRVMLPYHVACCVSAAPGSPGVTRSAPSVAGAAKGSRHKANFATCIALVLQLHLLVYIIPNANCMLHTPKGMSQTVVRTGEMRISEAHSSASNPCTQPRAQMLQV